MQDLQPERGLELVENDVDSLAGFFDLLSKYDFEDRQKLSGVDTGSADSAPAGSVSLSVEQNEYGAEKEVLS